MIACAAEYVNLAKCYTSHWIILWSRGPARQSPARNGHDTRRKDSMEGAYGAQDAVCSGSSGGHQGSVRFFASCAAEHARSAKRSHAAAISSNTVLSPGVLTN
jgi:hypothetical protein